MEARNSNGKEAVTEVHINLLNDSEWMQILKIVGLANSLNEDYLFRRSILQQLRVIIPYESAAFFLTDLSKAQHTEGFFTSPVGIDCEEGRLDEYVESAWRDDLSREKLPMTKSMVVRESDLVPEQQRATSPYYTEFLGGRKVVTCTFVCDRGPLGSLNLNRKLKDFSDKEVFILEVLEPHITNRLAERRLSVQESAHDAQAFFERHHITSREQEVLSCLLKGMTNDEISEDLCISPATTRKHLENIFRKTDVRNRLELILKIKQHIKEVSQYDEANGPHVFF